MSDTKKSQSILDQRAAQAGTGRSTPSHLIEKILSESEDSIDASLPVLADRYEKELKETEEVVEKTFPIIDKLEKRSIMNEVKLMIGLYGIERAYRMAIFYLFRIAVEKGPDGSFIVLDPEKVFALADAYQRKFIRAEQITLSKLKAFCIIVNYVNERELTKPSYDLVFKPEAVKPLSGNDPKGKGRRLRGSR